MLKNWRYYNHALLPTTPPHEAPKVEELKNKSAWSAKALFARYTTDFDCGYETQWWYIIKDTKLDLDKLKAKRRYEVKKGLKNCEVRKISSRVYAEQLYEVYQQAFMQYKNAGREAEKKAFVEACYKDCEIPEIEYWGAFDKETGELIGYTLAHVYKDYVAFTSMKIIPQKLYKNPAFALIYTMIIEYLHTQKKRYINDGERSIRHATHFQEYLVKYFGFRKAYCQLHIHYRTSVKILIAMLYPLRDRIEAWSVKFTFFDIYSILHQESIRRNFS